MKSHTTLLILVTCLFLACDCITSMASVDLGNRQDMVTGGEITGGLIERLTRHLNRIPGLLTGIDERVFKAVKVRNEFQSEVTELRMMIGRYKSPVERKRTQMAIQIKDENVTLLNDYIEKLSSAKEFLANVQAQFSDFRRTQAVIDQNFLGELTAFMNDTANLLQDPTMRSIMARTNGSKNFRM